MASLKGLVPRLAGLSSVLASGHLAVYVGLGLLVLLAVTATFGSDHYSERAQAVLRILFGRKQDKG
jgi:hypothetical protein